MPEVLAKLAADIMNGPQRDVFERNREIVPRARHGETRIEDGDRIEIVTMVGGG